MKGCDDMSKKHARIFLALMTAVCLVGAWWVPVYLPLSETVNYGCLAHKLCYDSGHPGAWRTLDNTPQMEQLTFLLRGAALRQTFNLSYGTVTLHEPGDLIVDLDINDLAEPTPNLYAVRIWRTRGTPSAAIRTTDGRTYRILDPAPLLDFLENEVEFE